MKLRVVIGLAWLALALPRADAVDPMPRSDSASKQFTVYCDDMRLRQRVVSFVEEVKSDVLNALGEKDRWKAPIVVSLKMQTPETVNASPATVRLVETPQGPKVTIDVIIGKDPAAVNLQKQVVRAVLLEYAYRGISVEGGMKVLESPWWVIEGIIQLAKTRDVGVDTEIYQTLVDNNKLPALEDVLPERAEGLGSAALALDQALALCLVRLLSDQQDGKLCLAKLVRDWPKSNGDPAAILKKEFPEIAANPQALQKWWTISLARFAASDRYKGFTVGETEKELAPLLKIEATADKKNEKKTFDLGDFAQYLKRPGMREVLAAKHSAIIALGSRANALYRPVIANYEAAFALLGKGKTNGVAEKIAAAEHTRGVVMRRMSEISDYMNWFEATQMGARSDTFDNYLKTANELSAQERKQSDPISRYLDDLEREF